jgi:hypothetical protein
MNCRAGARRSQGFGVPDFSFETTSHVQSRITGQSDFPYESHVIGNKGINALNGVPSGTQNQPTGVPDWKEQRGQLPTFPCFFQHFLHIGVAQPRCLLHIFKIS